MKDCRLSTFYHYLTSACASVVSGICQLWRTVTGNKVSATTDARFIEVGVINEQSKKKHNKIKTSKYSLLTFLPKNLSEQFRRIASFYFLIVTVIAIVIDSPVSPMTSIAPLAFMVTVTAVKQGYEDWLRHRADDSVNNQIVEIIHKGTVKEVQSKTISPGTLVRVRSGKQVPADLVLLCAAGEKGRCYVTTANLDGETNLKTLRVPLVAYTPDILPKGMRLEVPNPVADLYTFYGKLEIPGRDVMTLTTDNIMLRGSTVKNTEWAIGCAVYTGEETKLALNSRYGGNKFSSCEVAVNGFLIFFIAILTLEIVVSFVFKLMFDRHHTGHEIYLGPAPSPLTINVVLQDMLSFLLLYYYMIPMSLYVTIELYKFIGALFIGWDEDLRCDETGRAAVANTSDLNEELGQIEVLFSDKTGTLTKNLMVFKACSINGKVYEERDNVLYDIEALSEPTNLYQTDVRFFFTVLALCHSVQISSDEMKKLSAKISKDNNLMSIFRRKKENGKNGDVTNGLFNNNEPVNKIEYRASSPDEKALVEAAERVGVSYMGEDGNDLIVQVGSFTERYERLQIIEFTSERKRMSVVIKDKDDKIWLFCKGAESSILPLCKDDDLIGITDRDINKFAKEGLRTLAIAFREVPLDEYEKIIQNMNHIDIKNADQAMKQLQKLYHSLERDLTLLGATAVEDCLQDDVADTIASLRRAKIKVWVLTGDKVETAINVAQSCAHISDTDKKMFIINVDDQESIEAHIAECKRIVDEPGFKDLTLIVDGTSMAHVLDRPIAQVFADIALKCSAVLCCRLSPIQKAQIVKLIKNNPSRPITAAIGDGANDISMIQEAHVGFGIFGKEGYQAARSADYGFTKFSMLKKIILVLGHWYYQRLATLIQYFFYKNLVFAKLMLYFQAQSAWSTQSIFDSMFLTFYNLVFSAMPCIIHSVTEQSKKADLLLRDPKLYHYNRKNSLMSWRMFSQWFLCAIYHSILIFIFSWLTIKYSVISTDGKTVDLWCYGAALFHLLVVVINLKLWLETYYNTLFLMLSIVLSILSFVAFNIIYSSFNSQIDGDVLGTYQRLLSSFAFWSLNFLLIITALLPDYCLRAIRDRFWEKRRPERDLTVNVNEDSHATRF